MELEEAFRRIIGQHWQLIVSIAGIGLAIATLVHVGAATNYTASARLVLDTPDPKSRTEAGAIADTAQAIATSPAQVRAALGRIGVRRDPLNVANHDVTVRPLGTSGVLRLSVSDRNAQASAAIANSLAAQVIHARLDVSSGELQQTLAAIGKQIDDLGSRISRLDVQINALTAQAAPASAARSQRGAYAGQRALLSQRRVALEGERASLLSSAALRPKPSIISPATAPKHPDAPLWLPDLALGAILALILGVGIAGLVEMFRPTLVGEDVLAKEFDAPLLGRLESDLSNASIVDSMWLSEQIRLAVKASGVRDVRLLSAGPPADLESLATSLTVALDVLRQNGQPTQADDESTAPAKRRPRNVGINVFDLRTWSPNGGGTGLVLVSPIALKRNELVDVNRLLGMSRVPVIGLITYDRDRVRGQRQIDTIVSHAKTWSRRHVQPPSPR